MRKWIPNIAVFKYLKAAGVVDPSRENRMKNLLLSRYQTMMQHMSSNGYIYYGTNVGVWFNSYILKLLNYAKDVININTSHINNIKNYLKPKEHGKDPSPYPGIDKKGVVLAAYNVISFTETGIDAGDKAYLDSALQYIKAGQANADNYTLAISAYAFALNNHPDANITLDKLMEPWKNRDDEMISWTNAKNGKDKLSDQTEIASYAVLALEKSNRIEDARRAFKWLMTKRNSFGGFSNTQDTVIGIQALTKMAQHFDEKNINIDIEIKSGKEKKNFKVNTRNSKILQKLQLESDTRSVDLSAKGQGVAYFQIAYNYSMKFENETGKGFEIRANVISGAETPMVLEVCTKFDDNKVESGMALIEVELPSGYVYDKSTVDKNQPNTVRIFFQNLLLD